MDEMSTTMDFEEELEVFRTEDADAFGNTFYSEIDVLDTKTPAKEESAADAACQRLSVRQKEK